MSQGHVAEWLRTGLQNRVRRFNSGRGLHPLIAQGFGGQGFREAGVRRSVSKGGQPSAGQRCSLSALQSGTALL
jgi:hypothetical protein